jgi:CubicO group peptidase (beta-lactamase class C family)
MMRYLLTIISAASLAGTAQAATFDAKRLNAVIEASGLSGDVVVSEGGDQVFGYFGLLPERPKRDKDGLNWRLASVTKQVVAVLVMQEVAAGRLVLDQPISQYLPRFAGPGASKVTIRQLLQHRSGLPNPDDTETPAGEMPAFYRSGFSGDRDPVTGYCAGAPKGEPGGNWTYNNCDYMVLGAVLESATGKSWAKLVEERIAKPLRLKTFGAFPTNRWVRWGRVGGKREPEVDLATFGASAGLYGSAADVLTFNNALMDGRLLPPEALAEMWKGDPALGFMALGQWAFAGKLAGCEAPVRLIERRGAIGGIGVRNFIVPERKVALVILSDRGEFDFGEVWQGKGPSHDVLSAVLCPTPAK